MDKLEIKKLERSMTMEFLKDFKKYLIELMIIFIFQAVVLFYWTVILKTNSWLGYTICIGISLGTGLNIAIRLIMLIEHMNELKYIYEHEDDEE